MKSDSNLLADNKWKQFGKWR